MTRRCPECGGKHAVRHRIELPNANAQVVLDPAYRVVYVARGPSGTVIEYTEPCPLCGPRRHLTKADLLPPKPKKPKNTGRQPKRTFPFMPVDRPVRK